MRSHKSTDNPSQSQPAVSFAYAAIKRNGHLCCRRCLQPIDKLPHDCQNVRAWGFR